MAVGDAIESTGISPASRVPSAILDMDGAVVEWLQGHWNEGGGGALFRVLAVL
jgi:hypothetical protein